MHTETFWHACKQQYTQTLIFMLFMGFNPQWDIIKEG